MPNHCPWPSSILCLSDIKPVVQSISCFIEVDAFDGNLLWNFKELQLVELKVAVTQKLNDDVVRLLG